MAAAVVICLFVVYLFLIEDRSRAPLDVLGDILFVTFFVLASLAVFVTPCSSPLSSLIAMLPKVCAVGRKEGGRA